MNDNYYVRRNTNNSKIEFEANIKKEMKLKKLRKNLQSILNIRVVLALNYLKEYYQCKIKL